MIFQLHICIPLDAIIFWVLFFRLKLSFAVVLKIKSSTDITIFLDELLKKEHIFGSSQHCLTVKLCVFIWLKQQAEVTDTSSLGNSFSFCM